MKNTLIQVYPLISPPLENKQLLYKLKIEHMLLPYTDALNYLPPPNHLFCIDNNSHIDPGTPKRHSKKNLFTFTLFYSVEKSKIVSLFLKFDFCDIVTAQMAGLKIKKTKYLNQN